MKPALIAAAAALVLSAAPGAMILTATPAAANCYEIIGCDDSEYFSRQDLSRLSCQALWEVRNAIYWQNGYCFTTARAQRVFDNSQCYVTNQSQVRLNIYERENVGRIIAAERAKGCR
jgi:hypothetical protein